MQAQEKTKIDKSKLIYRHMNLEEVKEFIHRQNQEGWFLCENEAEAVFSIDPNGWFGLEYEGRLIGSLCIINYGDGFKYGSLYTILKEFRGQGLGPPLFEYGVKEADFENPAESSLGEAEFHIWPIYDKRKWEIYCKEHVFERTAEVYPKIEGIVDLKTLPLEKLYAYDKKVFGYSRESYLRLLLDHDDHYGVAKLNSEGEIIGYAILKKLRDELYKIAPWFADDKQTALELAKSADTLVAGKRTASTVLEVNTNVMEIAEELKWENMFTGYRIFMHKMPKTDFSRCYGIGAEFS